LKNGRSVIANPAFLPGGGMKQSLTH